MQVADLVRYKHDPKRVGVVVKINNSRRDTHLVLWNITVDGRQQWYVQPDWIEVINAGR